MQHLSQEQKDATFAHCQTVRIVDGVRWIKEHLNIRIGKSALGSWLQQERVRRPMLPVLAEIRDNQQGASFVSEAGAPTPLTVANSLLFANAVFKEFNKPEAERDENRLIRYMDLALKARDLEIRASAVQLSYERLRLEASKKAGGSAGEAPMPGEGTCDDREKTEKAMRLLFGEPPIGFTSETGGLVAEMEPEDSRFIGPAECQ